MSFKPIDFKNLPDETTPISAENLNYIQQGILKSNQLAEEVNSAYQDGDLKGDKGDKGVKGSNGVDGRNFEINGYVQKLTDLPEASATYLNQIWVTYEFGHLHFCDGSTWLDWGQFVGVKGDKGDVGDTGVFDVNTLSQSDLKALHEKLTPLNDYQYWSYQMYIDPGQSARFKVADLNLDLLIDRSNSTISYSFVPNSLSVPATYYINRLSNYSRTSFESTVSKNYQAEVLTDSGFTLDSSGYLPGKEQTLIQVIDPLTNMWYSVYFIGLGEGTMFIDVQKRVNKSRKIIEAT